MISFADKIAALEAEGYANAPAMAKLAHDVVLKAMEKCGFARNITVKGGVVMSSITGDIRRATMDMDNMREHDFRAVSDRVRRVFRSSVFMRRLSQDKANWLKEPVPNVVLGILEFLERCA